MTVEDKSRNENCAGEKVAADNLVNSELWGSDMYPERRGGKFKASWFKMLIGAAGRESVDKTRCEDNVYRCIKDSKVSLLFKYKDENSRRANFINFYFFTNKA